MYWTGGLCLKGKKDSHYNTLLDRKLGASGGHKLKELGGFAFTSMGLNPILA